MNGFVELIQNPLNDARKFQWFCTKDTKLLKFSTRCTKLLKGFVAKLRNPSQFLELKKVLYN